MRSSMHVHVGRVLVHDGDILGGAINLEVVPMLLGLGCPRSDPDFSTCDSKICSAINAAQTAIVVATDRQTL